MASPYLEGLLSRPDLDVSDEEQAWGLVVAADLAANPGDARRSARGPTEAVAAFRRLGDEQGLAYALLALGAASGNQGAARRGRRGPRRGDGHRSAAR